jgi:hypothetical protein
VGQSRHRTADGKAEAHPERTIDTIARDRIRYFRQLIKSNFPRRFEVARVG